MRRHLVTPIFTLESPTSLAIEGEGVGRSTGSGGGLLGGGDATGRRRWQDIRRQTGAGTLCAIVGIL